MVEINELLKLVDKALDKLYENEHELFESDASERNLVFHFSRYFIELFEKYNKEKIYCVDCEYNRNTFNEKMYKELVYEGATHKINPDFILHQRNSNDNNILAIEFKKYNNRNKKERYKDRLKLKGLTDNNAVFGYRLGLFIILGREREKAEIEKYINGNLRN